MLSFNKNERLGKRLKETAGGKNAKTSHALERASGRETVRSARAATVVRPKVDDEVTGRRERYGREKEIKNRARLY